MRGCSFLMTVHLKGDCSLYFFGAENFAELTLR